MDVKDTDYFDKLLQHCRAYRISEFSCEQTGLWERTLDNPTSLIFDRRTRIPSDDYPKHYYNFASYNELPARADVRNAILTCGILRLDSDVYSFGVVMFEMLSEVLAWYRRKVRDDKPQPLISLKCISFNSKEHPAMETTADKIEEALELKLSILNFLFSRHFWYVRKNPNCPIRFMGEEISEGVVREVKEETGVDI
nr:hypothetical protein [Tanacetum cinerariifolium]